MPRDDGAESELTDEQRDALLAALDLGYFAVPRQASLAEIAEELDVSDHVASRRLRSAMSTLFHENRELFERR